MRHGSLLDLRPAGRCFGYRNNEVELRVHEEIQDRIREWRFAQIGAVRVNVVAA
jgi:hypothetical protein